MQDSINQTVTTQISILKEAFPQLDPAIIEDVVWSSQGKHDLNRLSELLLTMVDEQPKVPPNKNCNKTTEGIAQSPQAIPHTSTSNYNTTTEDSTNPFLNGKPLTVREELILWRQELQKQSTTQQQQQQQQQQRPTIRSTRNTVSTPNIAGEYGDASRRGSFRGLFSRARQHEGDDVYSNNIGRTGSSSRQFIGTRSSISLSDDMNETMRLHQLRASRQRPLPELPPRRRSQQMPHDVLGTTNPFLAGSAASTTSINPPLPPPLPERQQHQGHRAEFTQSIAQDTNSYQYRSDNPFEETDIPPPAYSEIQKDTVVELP